MNLLAGVEQDFHRPQKSPGAYEWWHFDGTDDRSGYSFVIQFHAGNLFSAYYQDSLKTYWEKTESPLMGTSQKTGAPNPSTGSTSSPRVPSGRPTGSSVEPSGQVPIPNPLDYCGVSFRLFHKGAMIVESLQELSRKSLKASDKHGAVLLGPNRFNWDPRGDPPSYVLTVQAPIHGGGATVRARLFFTPLLKQCPALPQPEGPSTHTWILAAPLCHVEGTFQWVDREGESKKEVAFVGKGYHDHHFGSVPLGQFLRAWHWGRFFCGEDGLAYSAQIPVDGAEQTTGILLTFTQEGIQVEPTGFKLSRNRRNFFWLPYAKKLESANHPNFRLEHGQTLCDGPAYLIFADEAQWASNGKKLKGEGLSNYLYTPRLSSRFFFPMLKGKSLIVKPSEETDLPQPSGDVSTTRPVE